MSEKVLVIIATGERAKAQTGLMYAVNTAKYGWLDAVQLVFFGPAQELLLADEDMQELLRQFQGGAQKALACRFLADRAQHSESLSALGVDVVYVGEVISGFIRDGFTPMVW